MSDERCGAWGGCDLPRGHNMGNPDIPEMHHAPERRRSIPQTFPVIRLEVDHLRTSILHAFSEQALALDEDCRIAVENYCTPENIKAIIAGEVKRALDTVIREEVERYYRYGKGRQAVKAAVLEALG